VHDGGVVLCSGVTRELTPEPSIGRALGRQREAGFPASMVLPSRREVAARARYLAPRETGGVQPDDQSDALVKPAALRVTATMGVARAGVRSYMSSWLLRSARRFVSVAEKINDGVLEN
jgi:hypothetical protein